MVVLKLGLYLAVAACVWVSWASWSSGFPQETALLRGMVAFGAISLLAYLGELILATAPPAARSAPHRGEASLVEDAADDPEEHDAPIELPRAA